MTKKIIIITGTRADFGLISGLIRKLKDKNLFNIKLMVCCMHLSKKHGYSKKEILNEKIKINFIVNNLPKGEKDLDIINATALGIIKFGEILNKEKPDAILLTGDRFEMLSAGIASMFLKIPIIHIHGGEITKGSIDNIMRNLITKMSQFHLSATKKSKKRIIQMGENPHTVFNVGGLGAHNIKTEKLLTRNELEKKLNFNFFEHNILITIHPEINNSKERSLKKLNILLKSLKNFKESLKIFTSSNCDAGGDTINTKLKHFTKKNKNCLYFKNLGKINYLSMLKHVNCVIGNSSSGILEAPSLKTLTINLGERQEGREKASSIIDAEYKIKAISDAISKSKKKKFLNNKRIVNPYYKKDTFKNIIKIFQKIDLKYYPKDFYDL